MSVTENLIKSVYTPQYYSIHRAGRYMVYVYIYQCLHQKAAKCNWVNARTKIAKSSKQIDINHIQSSLSIAEVPTSPSVLWSNPTVSSFFIVQCGHGVHLHRFDGKLYGNGGSCCGQLW